MSKRIARSDEDDNSSDEKRKLAATMTGLAKGIDEVLGHELGEKYADFVILVARHDQQDDRRLNMVSNIDETGMRDMFVSAIEMLEDRRRRLS